MYEYSDIKTKGRLWKSIKDNDQVLMELQKNNYGNFIKEILKENMYFLFQKSKIKHNIYENYNLNVSMYNEGLHVNLLYVKIVMYKKINIFIKLKY